MNELRYMNQVKQLATNTLKYHEKLLGQNEPAVLNNFLKRFGSNAERRRLTDRDCQKIINIAKAVNHKYLKILRKSNQTIQANGVRHDA
jgi:hypothetical protein